MQPERAKGGENYQHVAIRLQVLVVCARPEHDVADTRAVSRRFRVRVREYLSGYLHVSLFVLVSSYFSLFFL